MKAASSSSSASREMLLETLKIAAIVRVGGGRGLLSTGGDDGVGRVLTLRASDFAGADSAAPTLEMLSDGASVLTVGDVVNASHGVGIADGAVGEVRSSEADDSGREEIGGDVVGEIGHGENVADIWLER